MEQVGASILLADFASLLLSNLSIVKFHLVAFYFVDTIKYAHMGRTEAQAEHQKSWA